MADPVEGSLVPMSVTPAHALATESGWDGDVCIHRFDLPPMEQEVEVLTYAGARFLPVVEPSDRIPGGYTLWAIVPVGAPVRQRWSRVLGTGDTVPAEALRTHDYIDTYRSLGYVWHVFVTKEGTR